MRNLNKRVGGGGGEAPRVPELDHRTADYDDRFTVWGEKWCGTSGGGWKFSMERITGRRILPNINPRSGGRARKETATGGTGYHAGFPDILKM